MVAAEINQAICDLYGRYYRSFEAVIGRLSCDPYFDFMRLLQAKPQKLDDAIGDTPELSQLKADLRRWLSDYTEWLELRERIDAGTIGEDEYGI